MNIPPDIIGAAGFALCCFVGAFIEELFTPRRRIYPPKGFRDSHGIVTIKETLKWK